MYELDHADHKLIQPHDVYVCTLAHAHPKSYVNAHTYTNSLSFSLFLSRTRARTHAHTPHARTHKHTKVTANHILSFEMQRINRNFSLLLLLVDPNHREGASWCCGLRWIPCRRFLSGSLCADYSCSFGFLPISVQIFICMHICVHMRVYLRVHASIERMCM